MLASLARAAAAASRAPLAGAAGASLAAATRTRAASVARGSRGFAASSSSSSSSGSGNRNVGDRLWESIRGSTGHRPHGRTWSYSSHRSRPWGKSSGGEGGSTTAATTTTAELVPSRPEARYREVLAVPLARRPLFPGVLMPVTVDDPKLVEALRRAVAESRAAGGGQPYVGAFLKKEKTTSAAAASAQPLLDLRSSGEGSSSPSSSSVDAEDLYEVGTFAQIHTLALSSGGGSSSGSSCSFGGASDDDISGSGSGSSAAPPAATAQLLLLGHRRLRRTGIAASAVSGPAEGGEEKQESPSSSPRSPLSPRQPLRVTVEHLRDEPFDSENDDELRATAMEAVATLKELLTMHPLYNEQLKSFAALGGDFHDPGRLADVAASLCSAPGEELQRSVLEELRVPERASASLLLLKKEAELCRLQADIGRRVEEKISRDQRRYFLTEQLRSIKKELGLEKDDKAALVQRFRERISETERRRRLDEDEGGGEEVERGAAATTSGIPEEARRVIDEELAKLSALEPSSSEFNVTRNYLEWLTAMPWGLATVETLDVRRAKETLDRDHFGLADVKARVLEFIAVGALRGGTAGKILCLAGPPGVGKTSVGRSIANALGRKYYRFSVGGLADVAEIKGHRRTYVGAMPGKAVQCLKACGVSDPLILIDEIDKLGRGHQGDPASALLELLDPEQNATFLDHYLDVPVDLSRVLFVCTANVLEAIPGPLLDRMEVIRIPGYYGAEKEAIARGYLEPAARQDAGVPDDAVLLEDAALRRLIDDYCNEAGVRNLKKLVEKVYRKAALKLVEEGSVMLPDPKSKKKKQKKVEDKEGEESSSSSSAVATLVQGTPTIVVSAENLPDFVGQPPFSSDRLYSVAEGKPAPPGVVTGLAWTAGGGSTLHVEAAVASRSRGSGKGSSGGGHLSSTGQLGEVMRESTTIAHTVARAFYARLAREGRSGVGKGGDEEEEEEDPSSSAFSVGDAARVLSPRAASDPSFFSDASIHVHVPAGATPKDGPSAGITLVTALLSLALRVASDPHLAMTGEVSLTGRVLPVGGVKEKVLAARRAPDVTRVALPEANRRDWDELAEDVKEGIQVSFHEDYGSVFEAAFGGGGRAEKEKKKS